MRYDGDNWNARRSRLWRQSISTRRANIASAVTFNLLGHTGGGAPAARLDRQIVRPAPGRRYR